MLNRAFSYIREMFSNMEISEDLSSSEELSNSEENLTVDAAVNDVGIIRSEMKSSDLAVITHNLDKKDLIGVLYLVCNDPLSILEQENRSLCEAFKAWTYNDVNWSKKLLEALCIIQNYQILHQLNYNKESLIQEFLPRQLVVTTYLLRKRKALYYLAENLNKSETTQLINKVKLDFQTKNMKFKDFTASDCYLEWYLLHWEVCGYDFGNLLKHLKSMDLIHLCEKLKAIIKPVNEEIINNIEDMNKSVVNVNKSVPQEITRSKKTWDNARQNSISSESSAGASMRHDNLDSFISSDTYFIDKDNPGVVLIINQFSFYREFEKRHHDLLSKEPLENRHGTDVDRDTLEETFKFFGFKVIIKENCDHELMLEEIEKVIMGITVECSLFICILSHGDKNLVYGSNSCKIKVSDIQSLMSKKNKKNLKHKPKVLILQSCQGKDIQTINPNDEDSCDELTTDGGGDLVPDTVDMLTFWATVPGYAAIRDKQHGTWFIQALCDRIKRFGHRKNFLEICTSTVDCVTQMKHKNFVMTPYSMSTLRKNLVLPKVSDFEDTSEC